MIQIDEVVNDPDLAQIFTILRSCNGQFLYGKWETETSSIDSFGVVANPTNKELQMVPEGDRAKGVMVFWSSEPIYATRANTEGGGASSDILVWRGDNFRVLDVKQFQDYGYYRAIATRMKAA